MLLSIGFFINFEVWLNLAKFYKMNEKLKVLHQTEVGCLKKFYRERFTFGYKNCLRFLNFLSIISIFAEFSFVFMGSLMSYTIEKTNYPMPMFYNISFLPPTNILTYLVNMANYAIFNFVTIYNYIGCTGFLFYAMTLAVANLEVAGDIIDNKEMISQELGYDKWVAIVMESISASKEWVLQNSKFFYFFLHFYRILLFTRKRYSKQFYLCEKMAYAALFIGWVVYHIDPAKMGPCGGGLQVTFALFVVTALNEHILDKVCLCPALSLRIWCLFSVCRFGEKTLQHQLVWVEAQRPTCVHFDDRFSSKPCFAYCRIFKQSHYGVVWYHSQERLLGWHSSARFNYSLKLFFVEKSNLVQ